MRSSLEISSADGGPAIVHVTALDYPGLLFEQSIGLSTAVSSQWHEHPRTTCSDYLPSWTACRSMRDAIRDQRDECHVR